MKVTSIFPFFFFFVKYLFREDFLSHPVAAMACLDLLVRVTVKCFLNTKYFFKEDLPFLQPAYPSSKIYLRYLSETFQWAYEFLIRTIRVEGLFLQN